MKPQIAIAKSSSYGFLLDHWWVSSIGFTNALNRTANIEILLTGTCGSQNLKTSAILLDERRTPFKVLTLEAGRTGEVALLAWTDLKHPTMVTDWPPRTGPCQVNLGMWECTLQVFVDGEKTSTKHFVGCFAETGLLHFTEKPPSILRRVLLG